MPSRRMNCKEFLRIENIEELYCRMKTVAVIGASANRSKFGNKAVRAYNQKGFLVFPVHPSEPEIEGLKCFARIQDVPSRPDVISVYLPPEVLLQLLPSIADRGCDELWVNPGAESELVVDGARKLGLNVVQACSILRVGESPSDY
jgi:predicted CoA-binding protein